MPIKGVRTTFGSKLFEHYIPEEDDTCLNYQPLNAYPFNLTGHPAASIPCGWSSEDLPIGMQIVGKRFADLTVLQVSNAFEQVAPWQDKRPSLK